MDAVNLMGVWSLFPTQAAVAPTTGHGKAVGGKRNYVRAILAEQMARSLLDGAVSRENAAKVVEHRVTVARALWQAQEKAIKRKNNRATWAVLLSEV